MGLRGRPKKSEFAATVRPPISRAELEKQIRPWNWIGREVTRIILNYADRGLHIPPSSEIRLAYRQARAKWDKVVPDGVKVEGFPKSYEPEEDTEPAEPVQLEAETAAVEEVNVPKPRRRVLSPADRKQIVVLQNCELRKIFKSCENHWYRVTVLPSLEEIKPLAGQILRALNIKRDLPNDKDYLRVQVRSLLISKSRRMYDAKSIPHAQTEAKALIEIFGLKNATMTPAPDD